MPSALGGVNGLLAMSVDPHRLAELRSLAYHREVARRLRDDPRLVEEARANVRRWLRSGAMNARAARWWLNVLDRSVDEIADQITDVGEAAAELRASTPFAGVLTPRERWALWASVRAEVEAGARGDA